MTTPGVAPRHDEVTLRYPVTMLPRSRALSDLVLEPGPTPERLDLGLRRVLARDGHNIEEQMLAFLELERIHFLEEGTRDAAEFHLNGLN